MQQLRTSYYSVENLISREVVLNRRRGIGHPEIYIPLVVADDDYRNNFVQPHISPAFVPILHIQKLHTRTDIAWKMDGVEEEDRPTL